MISSNGETSIAEQCWRNMHAEDLLKVTVPPSRNQDERGIQDVQATKQAEQEEAVDKVYQTPDTLKPRASTSTKRPSNVPTTASSKRSYSTSTQSSLATAYTDHDRGYTEEGYLLLERPADRDLEAMDPNWHLADQVSPMPIDEVEVTRNEEEIRLMALEIAADEVNAMVEEQERQRPQTPKPKPLTAELHPEDQPYPSPRSHINAVQGQNIRLPSSPPLQPLIDLYEGFISDDDQDDLEIEPGRATEAKRKVRAIRIKTLSLRANLRMKRKQLQRKEATKIAADEEFMKFMRGVMVGSGTVSEDFSRDLEHYFTAMQNARDEFGPLEDEYARLTDALDDLEFELARAEGRVYKGKASTSTSTVAPDADLVVSESGSALSISFGDREEYHPLVLSYFEKVGDLDLAIENIENMKEEQRDLRNDMETKHHRGETFDTDLEAFLVQLPTKISDLQTQIDEMEIEADQLRAQCEEQGFSIHLPTNGLFASSMDREENPSETTDEGNNFEQDDLARQIKQLRSSHDHSMFPLLFCKPDPSELFPPAASLDPEGKGKSLEVLITEFDEHNKSDRINRWLLYDLRTSPLGIDLLRQVYLECLEMCNIDIGKLQTDILDWQQSVLKKWSTDGANLEAEAFRQPQTREYSSQLSSTSSTKRDTLYG